MFVKSELWTEEKMRIIATACIVLHNMVVEVRRDTYVGDSAGCRTLCYNSDDDETDMTLERPSELSAEAHLLRLFRVSDDIRSKSEHSRLQRAVIEHVWNQWGHQRATEWRNGF
jgi:Plant transposon protein